MNPTPAEAAAAREAARLCRIERQLDEALAATFPASDPVAIVTSQHEEAWDEDEDPQRYSGRGQITTR